MLRRVTTPAPIPPLLGYADRFSAAPGETIQFMVSAEVPRYRASLVRLIQGDESPAGPGYNEEWVACSITGDYPGRRQSLVAGSYVQVPASPEFDLSNGFTIQCWLWPTMPNKTGGQGLVARWRGFALGLDESGRLELWLAMRDGVTERIVDPGPPLARWRWAFASASYDAASGVVRLVRAPTGTYAPDATSIYERRVSRAGPIVAQAADLFLASRGLGSAGEDCRRRPVAAYNGKLDRPRVFNRALGLEEIEALRHDAEPQPDAPVAAWDFGALIGSSHVPDTSSHRLDGECVNMPTRAVTDHTWKGREVRWDLAPDEYRAIHFHDDDLEDTGWQPDFAFTIPPGLRSGVYAAHLEADGGEEYIPFLRPTSSWSGHCARRVPRADVDLHGLRQRTTVLERGLQREARASYAVDHAAARHGPVHGRTSRAGVVAIRRAQRRKRLLLLLTAATNPEHAAEVPSLAPARITTPFRRRSVPARLARSARVPVRRDYR